MPRRSGQVIEHQRESGTVYGLRFQAYGKRRYVVVGSAEDGWTRAKAQTELQNVLADVRRGIWQPRTRAAQEPQAAAREVPTFHRFASEWFAARKQEGGRQGGGLTAAGTADLEWRITNHLLPAFAPKRVDEITVEDVDRYRLAKARAGHLSPGSINKTLTTLSAILEAALEYEWITRNPARGRRRRLAAPAPRRSWLDRAEHISALLDGATKLDREATSRHGQRRALLATLVFAGLRIGEALTLRWRDVDLARGTIIVRASKTDAGVRTVNVLPVLRDELLAYRARINPAPAALVFGTSLDSRQGNSNVRRRILGKSVEKASEALAEQETEPLPAGLTPHSLRRTFASLLFAVGETPPYVMAQMGHTTPNLTLAIYARQMDRRDGEPERLKALVEGRDWATPGQFCAGATSEKAAPA